MTSPEVLVWTKPLLWRKLLSRAENFGKPPMRDGVWSGASLLREMKTSSSMAHCVVVLLLRQFAVPITSGPNLRCHCGWKFVVEFAVVG